MRSAGSQTPERAVRPSALRTLLARVDFRRLLLGQTLSALGDWMGTVALMALVLDLTGSSTAVGGILVLRLAPAMVAGPLATRVALRWDRRRTMLSMDLVRAAIVVLIPFVSAIWWVYLWAFMLEAASLVFLPARDASIPDLAGTEQLPLANGLVLGSSYGAIPLGAGAFGLTAAVLGGHRPSRLHGAIPVVFWVDAATFLFSFFMVARIGALGTPDAGDGAHERGGGFAESLRIPMVRAMAPATVAVSLGLGTLFSLGIVYVRKVLGATDTEFGVLVALFGVGAVLGLGLLQAVGQPTVGFLRTAVFLQGSVIAGMSLAPGVGLAFLGAAGFGLATAAALATAMSILQDRIGGTERVMAFTAFHVLIRAGLSVAALSAGAVADLIHGVRWPVVGSIPPARAVLLVSGLVVAASAGLSRGLGAEVAPRRGP